jgi:hypothetical protein
VHFYVGSDAAQREAAQKVLLTFDQVPDCISRCKDILDMSTVRGGGEEEDGEGEGESVCL